MHRREGLPDGSMEYLLYQTLVGSWPLSTERGSAIFQPLASL